MKTEEIKSLINVKQAAEYCGLPVFTIYHYVKTGQIPHYRKTNGRVLFKESELDNWLSDNIVKVDNGTSN